MSSRIASGQAPARSPVTSRAPQRQRGRDRVTALLAAAAVLFVERGYDAATMTEIAARAGASIGSLYLFFPTKPALAQAMLADLAETLSARLDTLQLRVGGSTAAAIADALFLELSAFLQQHPVYAVLIDLAGDDAWRQAVRTQRRLQVAALFELAAPALPADQAERLALLVPSLMRSVMMLGGEPAPLRAACLQELRAMLHHHLAWASA
ncbi:MAG TPA: helix-turn-helix domain-containing protein [Acetobacteraceae bacterium]